MKPLAERMRPFNFDNYIGQKHLIGTDAPLRKALNAGIIPSMIFWGPPGTGKTTLAQIIGQTLDRQVYELSAINSGVKDIRAIIDKAKKRTLLSKHNPILFIDEIHRFSKSQQDSLLGAVEKGIVTLIGATTENPSFEVISALLSRSQVYVLQDLSLEDLKEMINKAIKEDEVLKTRSIKVEEYELLIQYSCGDGRKLYNLLEILVSQTQGDVIINNALVQSVLQRKLNAYDKDGEQHYDIISAFIKSIRGSDPNATLYWMAKMIDGGEDPKFICRRMIIAAAEDIGLANPNALLMANTCMQTIQMIGMPEARIILSQTAIYLAMSPKSNSAYLAIDAALDQIRNGADLPVPLHLRNAPTKLMKEMGYGKDYKYAHNYPGNFVTQDYLPDEISSAVFYTPSHNVNEAKYNKQLKERWGKKYEE